MFLTAQPKNHQPYRCRQLMPMQLSQFQNDGIFGGQKRKKKWKYGIIIHIYNYYYIQSWNKKKNKNKHQQTCKKKQTNKQKQQPENSLAQIREVDNVLFTLNTKTHKEKKNNTWNYFKKKIINLENEKKAMKINGLLTLSSFVSIYKY